MRLSMISRIIQTEVNVICRSEADEADNIDRGLNNSGCHAKTQSNNCFLYIWRYLKVLTGRFHPTKQIYCGPFCLFYFRALLCLICWSRWGLGTTASKIFFWMQVRSRKTIIGRWARQQLKLRNKHRILWIIWCSLTNQEREYKL
jgi:hypothetical protein